MRDRYYAHTKPAPDDPENPDKRAPKSEWQVLEDHLRAVADMAASFAASFDSADWARLAGLWHDLGKYRETFQRYLEGNPIPGADKQHAIIGALHAAKLIRPGDRPVGERSLAYMIAGHHGGLPDWAATHGKSSLHDRLKEASGFLEEARMARPPSDILDAGTPAYPAALGGDTSFWIRMVFSCLVDADRLDTERFGSPEKAGERGMPFDADRLCGLLEDALATLGKRNTLEPINVLRTGVQTACKAAGKLAPGVFSLTVPTGGGKTLASARFALEHARIHQLKRVIYVIPYTSIIEQTADIFSIFGDAVVEHHCQVIEPDAESEEIAGDRNRLHLRLATENWDAPIIVTTAVQFFESLFSANPSRCRKLHNIAESVVILDEAQLLPPPFLAPILQALRQLTTHYGVTLLLCTATQPALRSRIDGSTEFHGFDEIREIIPDPAALHRGLRRTRLELVQDLQPVADLPTLARQLHEHESILCIVNTRRACRELHAELLALDPTAIHLSAYMCGQHRSEMIARIKLNRLSGNPLRVISTSLVEAGVDVDFPVVYRSLAGLDSIAQAAGRCNREGRIAVGGLVRVFVEPDARRLLPGSEFTRRNLPDWLDDPFHPAHFEAYFRDLYWQRGPRLDECEILKKLTEPEGRYAFRSAADAFRLIPDESLPVVVRYGEGAAILARLRSEEPSRTLFRRLQRYTVTIPRHLHAQLVADGIVIESDRWPGFFYQAENAAALYDQDVGLTPEAYIGSAARPPGELMV